MKITFILLSFCTIFNVIGQSVSKTMLRLPDTGQTTSYTNTFGEDNDYNIFPPFFIKNANKTVADTVTTLMWQQADGGEMTHERAIIYADTLTLAGFTDWRLPTAHEAFSILNHQKSNPALDINIFTSTAAEYWWTSDLQVNDPTKVWVTNSGGGIGNHAKSETVSAGGIKKIHARAVRNTKTPSTLASKYTENGSGTANDQLTGLTWQKIPHPDSLTWENALSYAENLTLGGFSDWRLPNIKELQSISDEKLVNPSVSTTVFTNIGNKKYWSSTSLPNQTTKAWYLFTQIGITTYEAKTARLAVICVRGNDPKSTNTPQIILGTNQSNSPSTESPELSIYPNPASNELNIELNHWGTNSTQILIKITNEIGQIVFSITTDSKMKSQKINTQSFPSGVYLLTIQNETRQITKKIIILK